MAVLIALIGANASAGEATGQALVGTWECGPKTVHAPGFDLVTTTRITRLADRTYSDATTSVYTPDTGTPMTTRNAGRGGWSLDGEVVTTEVHEVRFLYSSDPDFSREQGQRLMNELLSKKSVYRSRILELDGDVLRSIPVDATHKEAEVESVCRRLAG